MGNENKKFNNKNNLNIKNISTLKIHKNSINDIIFYTENNKNYLISVSKDKTIKISDLIEMKIKMIINIHSNQINYINILNNKNLISCGDDKKIIIFKLDLKNQKFFIVHQIKNAHNLGIIKVIEIFDNLLSISFDYQIFMWKFDRIKNEYFKCFFVKEKSFIYDILLLKQNEFVDCTEKFEINFYKIENNENSNENNKNSNENKIFNENNKIINENNKIIKIHTINNIEISFWHNILFKFNEKFLFVGGINCIFIIDLNEYKYINLIECDFWIFSFCKLNENYFLTGDLFNIKLFKCEHEKIWFQAQKKIHNKSITKIIKINENFLISSSIDNLIKIFDIKEILFN